ncbi:chromosome partitioning protein ParA [Hapalosiphon sp. MRB220]|nr:chromosome partitioning protein ParA [Hapalosiphon sp. MRB220]
MAYKIAIFNMKGGVGKSATATNLADGISRFHHKKVLLVDIDPQGTSSASLGIEIWKLETQLKDVLQSDSPSERKQRLKQATIKRDSHQVDVLPSNILLAVEELQISGLPGRENLLKRTLSEIDSEYDFILIDCPPNIGVFSINALKASDSVIVPVDMSYVGLLGVQGVEYAFNLVKNFLDHEVNVLGVLATKFDGRQKISKDVLTYLQEYFQESMFKTIIPITVRISEAPSFGVSIFDHDPKGAGAKAYRELMNELLQRI